MRILVIGAGAIGSVVGGLLASHGHEVHLVGRATHMQAIRDQGLRISGIFGEHHVCSIHTATEAKTISSLQPDAVLITVKSFDTANAIEAVAPFVGQNTLVVSYQNGLGNIETIADRIGWQHCVGARVIFGSRINEPGKVEVTVIAQPTAIGAYKQGPNPECVRELVQAMDTAGLPTVLTDNIAREMWSKVAYNSALNPLSALLDCNYGQLRDNPATWAIMEDIIREIYAVAQAMGICLEPNSADVYLPHFHDTLIPPTAAHYASMHADLKQGKRSEIDALNGAIVRFGETHHIPCPINKTLTQMIKAHETFHKK